MMASRRRPRLPVLGQRYRLMRQIDSGGMGSVWLAEAVHLRSLVAVKVMDRAVAATPEAAQRFLHEARTAASLRSPHVVQILDYGVHESIPFIVMELLEGESLATRLKREGRLASWEQTELVLRHVARALGRAHDAGVIHRDLKPGNIFLVRDEEEEIVKLLDFGIAKSTLSPLGAPLASDTRTGEFLGSPAYSSPEQLQASKAIDHRSDIWSLGIIAYECLLGQKPFASDNFIALLLSICTGPIPVPSEQGRVPAGFDAWFARVCARDVEQRFQNVREASAELKRLVDAARGTPEALAAAAVHAAAVHPPAVHAPLLQAPAERAPSAPPPDGVALAPLPGGAPRAPAPPSLTEPMLLVAAPSLRDSPRIEPPTHRADTVPLAPPQVGSAPRRRTKALTVMLALPAAVALATFTLGASSSRAALDWSRLALSAHPPSAPERHDDAPERGSDASRPAAPERGAVSSPLASPPGGRPPRGLEPVPGSQASSSEVPSSGAPTGAAPNSDESPFGVVAAVAEPSVASKLDGDPGAKETPEPSTSPAPYSPGLESVARERGAPAPLPEATPAARHSPRVLNDSSPGSPSSTTNTSGTVRSSTARLTVTASEPSTILLDGTPFGTTPLESIRVEPGTHEVTFVQNGKRSTETLTIRRGEHKRVEARFESPPGDGLNEAAVKRTIQTHRSSVVDTCMTYAVGALAPGDATSVRVPVTIRVEPSGEVRSVVTEAEPPGYLDLRRCVEERVAAWRFPGARAETVVTVAFVFVQR